MNLNARTSKMQLMWKVFKEFELAGFKLLKRTLFYASWLAKLTLAAVLASQFCQDLVDRSLDELWLLHGKRRKPDHRQKGGVGLFGEGFPRQHGLEV